jgi:hypothetical protein
MQVELVNGNQRTGQVSSDSQLAKRLTKLQLAADGFVPAKRRAGDAHRCVCVCCSTCLPSCRALMT